MSDCSSNMDKIYRIVHINQKIVLVKENHKRKTKNGEKKLTMKVMWPPNNKVNESITKVTVTKKNCVSQRRKWKLYNANVFSNQKKKESVDSFAWPFHTRLQFKFFGMRSFFGQCNVFFFFSFRTYECNSGSLWICYDAVFFFLIPTFLPFAHLSVGTCAASHRFSIRCIPI